MAENQSSEPVVHTHHFARNWGFDQRPRQKLQPQQKAGPKTEEFPFKTLWLVGWSVGCLLVVDLSISCWQSVRRLARSVRLFVVSRSVGGWSNWLVCQSVGPVSLSVGPLVDGWSSWSSWLVGPKKFENSQILKRFCLFVRIMFFSILFSLKNFTEMVTFCRVLRRIDLHLLADDVGERRNKELSSRTNFYSLRTVCFEEISFVYGQLER